MKYKDIAEKIRNDLKIAKSYEPFLLGEQLVHNKELQEQLQMELDAVIKQIEVRPQKNEAGQYFCPVCESIDINGIRCRTLVSLGENHCNNCGNRFDWGF